MQGDSVAAGEYFFDSKIRKLGLFSKDLFGKKLAPFIHAKSYEELKSSLEAYLWSLIN